MRTGAILFLMLAFLAVLGQVSYAQESAAACLENATKALDEEVSKKVDPELVAMQNKIDYPVKKPSMPWNQIYKNALKEVEAVLAKTYDVKSQEQLFLEISKKYAPFKIGERISVVQRVKYARTITGRYQGKNNLGHVHIGSSWIPISDFDDDTIARFDPDECDRLIKKKLKKAVHKQKLVLDSARRAEILRIAPRMLRENGYYPKNTDVNARSYLESDNWESQDQRLERLVNAQKEKLKESIADDFIDKYMTERGFAYDEASETYRSKDKPKQNEVQNTEPADNEPKEQQNEKKGLFQKMKDIF
ncbi:MAG: hypothetical protein IKS20_04165 [Victivallales bacterium]|nr:hypothetical protein [Victivallales bacterium]